MQYKLKGAMLKLSHKRGLCEKSFTSGRGAVRRKESKRIEGRKAMT